MDSWIELTKKKPKIDLSNGNYKHYYHNKVTDDYLYRILSQKGETVKGKIVFEAVFDDGRATAGQELKSIHDWSDDDSSDDEETPVEPFRLLEKHGGWRYKKRSVLKAPKNRRLFVLVRINELDMLGDEFASHACLLFLDGRSKTVEFFDPNPATGRSHRIYLDLIREYAQKLVPHWPLRDASEDFAPHEMFRYRHGLCALWACIYGLMRSEGVDPKDMARFFLGLGQKKTARLISNFMEKAWLATDPAGYRAKFAEKPPPRLRGLIRRDGKYNLRKKRVLFAR